MIEKYLQDRLQHALAVRDELDAWCEQFDSGMEPLAELSVSRWYVLLRIGEVSVWDSEAGYHHESIEGSDLTAQKAIDCYKKSVQEMAAWPK